MFLVEYTELTNTAPVQWSKLDNIATLHDLKGYGWSRCVKDGKARIYVCYKLGQLAATLVFYKQSGCVKIKEDTIIADGFITRDMLRESARKAIDNLTVDTRHQRIFPNVFLTRL